MRILRPFLYFSLCIFMFTGCAQKQKQYLRDIASLQENNGMEGVWFLQGSSSTRGPYNGELELRKSHDGTFDVVRVVTYINYFFDGLKVQEVWTGKAVTANNMLTISYDLRQGEFITKLDGVKREPDNFKHPVAVISRFSPSTSGLVSKFTDKKVSDYSEWMTAKRNLAAEPLWVDKRISYQAKGQNIPANVRKNISKFKSTVGFDKDPLIKASKNNPIFKNEQPVVLVDPTDYKFYKESKDIIRVVNKITDDINITEAVVKRNAYVPSLQEKARGYDENTRRSHFNEANLVAAAVVDPSGKVLSYTQDNEAALTTGMYLAAQAMRFEKTKDNEALDNVKKSLKGLLVLLNISPNSKTVARSVASIDVANPEEIPAGWMRGTGINQNLMWTEGADKETFVAITHGLLWAMTVLPRGEVHLWQELTKNIGSLPDKEFLGLKAQDRSLAMALSAFAKNDKSADHLNKAKLEDAEFYWNGTADWKTSSLSVIEKVNFVMAAELLSKSEIRDQWREKLMEDWVTLEPAQRHLSTMAAYGFAFKYGARGEKFKSLSGEAKFNEALKRSVWGLREIPYPRPNFKVSIDHSLKSDWSVSPIPKNFWSSTPSKRAPAANYYQGLYQYPAFELQAFSSRFLWTEPAFGYQVNHNKDVENTGVDYLYGYWLARYAGVDDVL